MATVTVKIEMKIAVDELQYENDGFIGKKNIEEAFKKEFELGQIKSTEYDLEYSVINSKVEVDNFISQLEINHE